MEKSEFETLEKGKIPLTDEERAECLKRKAVWYHGLNGKPSPAVWKSVNSRGKTTYVSSTHRLYQKASTLKGATKLYHSKVKQTA